MKTVEIGGAQFRCVPKADGGFELVSVAGKDGSSHKQLKRELDQPPSKPGNDLGIPKRGTKRKLPHEDEDTGCESFDEADNQIGEGEEHEQENDKDDDYGDEDEDDINERGSVKKKKRERVHWNYEETERFLDLYIQMNAVEKMDNRPAGLNKNVFFKRVMISLNKAGLYRGKPKTVAQCRSKLKKLKMKFFDRLRNNNKSGQGSKICPFYDKLSILFLTQPHADCDMFSYESGEPSTSWHGTATSSQQLSAEIPEIVIEGGASPCSSNDEQKHHKYKSGTAKSNSVVSFLKDYVRESAARDKQRDIWFGNLLEQQQKSLQTMTQTFANTITEGLKAIAQMMVSQSAAPPPSAPPQQQPFLLPWPQFPAFVPTVPPSSTPSTSSNSPSPSVSPPLVQTASFLPIHQPLSPHSIPANSPSLSGSRSPGSRSSTPVNQDPLSSPFVHLTQALSPSTIQRNSPSPSASSTSIPFAETTSQLFSTPESIPASVLIQPSRPSSSSPFIPPVTPSRSMPSIPRAARSAQFIIRPPKSNQSVKIIHGTNSTLTHQTRVQSPKSTEPSK